MNQEPVRDADHRNFWSDSKLIRSCKSGVAGIVDGHTNVDSIDALFANKYHEIYSCVS